MRKEEILAMEAGQELDALVAESVMGWQKPKDLSLLDKWLRFFKASTDISVAWQVVEKMISDYPNMWITIEFAPVNWWTVNFSPGFAGYEHQTQSIEESICKAALLAKGLS